MVAARSRCEAGPIGEAGSTWKAGGMDRSLVVALAQQRSGSQVGANAAAVAETLATAADRGAQLVVLPEATMACFGTPLAEVAEPLDGPFATSVRRAAHRAGVVAVVGMMTPADDGRVHNTLLVTGPGVEDHYDKIHLFDALGSHESRTVAPGDRPVVVEVAGVGVGLTTCFDVRFPDLSQSLARRGAEVIVVAASWASGPGKADQWDVLTRARALDSRSFVVACDQPFTDPGESKAALGIGHSRVVDPWGALRAQLGPEPGLLVHRIDLGEVATARARLPLAGIGGRGAAGRP